MVTYVASWVAVILKTKKKKKKKERLLKHSNSGDLKNIDISDFLQPPHGP